MDMATDEIPHAVKAEAYSIELNVETPIIPGPSTALHAPTPQLVLWPCPVYKRSDRHYEGQRRGYRLVVPRHRNHRCTVQLLT
jgi:hypothetical protein